MKKIILLSVLLFSTIAFSQTWKYNSGGNVFDGKYRTAHVIGKCSDFPYNKPGLFLNIFEEKDMNLYIANSGYYSSEDDVEILFVFNNEPNTIYYSNSISLSKDNGTIFLLSFKSDTSRYISRMNFINKLKKSSKLDVRIKSSYKNRDLNFSMSGSTNAINYVLTTKYLNYVVRLEQEVESEIDSIVKQENIKTLKKEENIKRIEIILSELGFDHNEIPKVISELKLKKFKNNFSLFDINRIEQSVYLKSKYTKLDLYDINNYRFDYLALELPAFFEKFMIDKKKKERQIKVKDSLKKIKDSLNEIVVEKKHFESAKKNLLNMIERYNFSGKTNLSVLNNFEKSYHEEWFDFKNIDSVNILKPQKKGDVVMRIYFKNILIVSLNDIDISAEYKKKMKTNKPY